MAELTLDDLPQNTTFVALPWLETAIPLLRHFDCLNEEFYRVFFEEMLTEEVFRIPDARKLIFHTVNQLPFSWWSDDTVFGNDIAMSFRRSEDECVYLKIDYKGKIYVRQYC